MLRKLHSLPGIVAAVLVAFLALSGALLALNPALEHLSSGQADQASVAQVAAAVAETTPGVQRIVHTASGSTIAYAMQDGVASAQLIDPTTGAATGAYEPSPFFTFLTELHRSLFLGDAGHAVAGIGALAMAVLSISGLLLLVARLGGWRKLFATAKGTRLQRLHVELGRMAMPALLLSALTGIYMSLVGFGFVSDGSSDGFAFAPTGSGGVPAAVIELSTLAATPLSDLRELVFPAADDAGDVFTLTTSGGTGYVDQASGELISYSPNNLGQSVYELFYTLHTGQGLWWLGLILGMAALMVPVMALSGTVVWWSRRQGRPRIVGNVAPQRADAVILVGSEGNSTWGFAAELHRALTEAGRQVHIASMNDVARGYARAGNLFILTSTYGNGAAPASASQFLAKLAKWPDVPRFSYAVLGFGDHTFQHYNAYASEVDESLAACGWSRLQPVGLIDRQSSQAFAAWGADTGARLGLPLELNHVPASPRTTALELVGRVDYGAEIQAPAAVLRFAPASVDARGRRSRLPRFEAGDLLGVTPPGSAIPRYYSLASGTQDGFAEICVRKQQGGQCSSFLTGLEPGSRIEAFVRSNPDFRPAPGNRPVVMIGNGVGIAPFIGFVWSNRRHRPMHLYWGGRNPASDFLYEDTLQACVADHRLVKLTTAFSRVDDGSYVQDRVLADAATIRELVAAGAQFLVCGSRDMATGVAAAIDQILSPLGDGIAELKAKGRYLEDVF